MKPLSFMLIAGEASGDTLAAELVSALSAKALETDSKPTSDLQPLRTGLAPRFFGAGGPRMQAAGVELAFDLTQHSVIGISDVLKNYAKFKRLFDQLLKLAIERKPDVIVGVDYGGFNLRFARAIRKHAGRKGGWFQSWSPKIVQFISPQVWASRAGRAYQMAEDHDLVLSIFPFEKEWYAKRVPKLKVEFVGHPMIDRFQSIGMHSPAPSNAEPVVLLLPGSRIGELRRHLPVMLGALKTMQSKKRVRPLIVLPNETLVQQAKELGVGIDIKLQIGDLHSALAQADVAMASTGTVTMECAFFGVPTVTLYKTSWSTYQIARRIITVKWLTMPNILADEEIYPEFVQNAATSENIANAALDLLEDKTRRALVKTKLGGIVAKLGGPGANARAADAIIKLVR
jgi:lipid-A-disaccharide synthase